MYTPNYDAEHHPIKLTDWNDSTDKARAIGEIALGLAQTIRIDGQAHPTDKSDVSEVIRRLFDCQAILLEIEQRGQRWTAEDAAARVTK